MNVQPRAAYFDDLYGRLCLIGEPNVRAHLPIADKGIGDYDRATGLKAGSGALHAPLVSLADPGVVEKILSIFHEELISFKVKGVVRLSQRRRQRGLTGARQATHESEDSQPSSGQS